MAVGWLWDGCGMAVGMTWDVVLHPFSYSVSYLFADIETSGHGVIGGSSVAGRSGRFLDEVFLGTSCSGIVSARSFRHEYAG
jgi:hypothetical protein